MENLKNVIKIMFGVPFLIFLFAWLFLISLTNLLIFPKDFKTAFYLEIMKDISFIKKHRPEINFFNGFIWLLILYYIILQSI
jgi:hypothetical protein